MIVAVVLSWVAVCGPGSEEASPALLLDKAPSLLWNLGRGEVAFTHQVSGPMHVGVWICVGVGKP